MPNAHGAQAVQDSPLLTRSDIASATFASKAIYSETPNVGTKFRVRPQDVEIHKRAEAQVNRKSLFVARELLPPLLYRTLRDFKRKLR